MIDKAVITTRLHRSADKEEEEEEDDRSGRMIVVRDLGRNQALVQTTVCGNYTELHFLRFIHEQHLTHCRTRGTSPRC